MVAQQKIAVGDTVRFTLVNDSVRGVVIEDRGPIGANRLRIFRIRVPNDPYEDDLIELPEDELSLDNCNE